MQELIITPSTVVLVAIILTGMVFAVRRMLSKGLCDCNDKSGGCEGCSGCSKKGACSSCSEEKGELQPSVKNSTSIPTGIKPSALAACPAVSGMVNRMERL